MTKFFGQIHKFRRNLMFAGLLDVSYLAVVGALFYIFVPPLLDVTKRMNDVYQSYLPQVNIENPTLDTIAALQPPGELLSNYFGQILLMVASLVLLMFVAYCIIEGFVYFFLTRPRASSVTYVRRFSLISFLFAIVFIIGFMAYTSLFIRLRFFTILINIIFFLLLVIFLYFLVWAYALAGSHDALASIKRAFQSGIKKISSSGIIYGKGLAVFLIVLLAIYYMADRYQPLLLPLILFILIPVCVLTRFYWLRMAKV